MCSKCLAAISAGTMILLCATAGTGAAAVGEPLPAPPPDLVERTRGAWIDIYDGWLEAGEGGVIPVDPGPVFCVGTDGFAVTDQNAVAGSVHQFATIRGRGPFAARTRAFDPDSGLAAVQLNPQALEGVPCLQRPADDAAPVVEGDVLFALGPAGAEPVPLRVKKVGQNALSFKGGLQKTFLAGSPLVDANGLLRGVLVAGTKGGKIGKTEATGALAGLAHRRHASRAIPLASALTLVEQVKKQRDAGMPVPPAGPVTQISEEVFPSALRAEPGVTAADLALYVATTKEATVEFLTPASLDAQAKGKPTYSPGRGFFCFHRHREMWEPMVVVQQAPQFEWTSGSNAAAVLAVIFALPIVLGGGDPTFRATYTFPKSQGTLAVERGGERFVPDDAFVDCFEELVPLEKEPGKIDLRQVRGCRTFYLFPPKAFAPGADVVVHVTLDKEGKTATVPVRPETQARIAADFARWQAAASKSVEAPTSDAELVLVPTPGVPYVMKSGGNTQLRIFTPEGYTYSVTRLMRDGAPVIAIPLVLAKWGPTMVSGLLYIGRDEISFEPALDPRGSHAFTVPRASVTVDTSFYPRLEIEADGKDWNFDPVVLGMRPISGGEFYFGAAMKEAKTAAVQMSAILLGDFDLALRAFDEPALLQDMLVKPAAHDEGTPEETP